VRCVTPPPPTHETEPPAVVKKGRPKLKPVFDGYEHRGTGTPAQDPHGKNCSVLAMMFAMTRAPHLSGWRWWESDATINRCDYIGPRDADGVVRLAAEKGVGVVVRSIPVGKLALFYAALEEERVFLVTVTDENAGGGHWMAVCNREDGDLLVFDPIVGYVYKVDADTVCSKFSKEVPEKIVCLE